VASRRKKQQRRRIAAKKPARKRTKAAPGLTPEQIEARDAFLGLIDAAGHNQWSLGDLANQWAAKWKRTGRYRGFSAFYKREIAPLRTDRALAYSTLTAYARVAASWSEALAVALGMAKLTLVWEWLTLHQLPFPADPSSFVIRIPGKDGTGPADKTVASATVEEIRRALDHAKRPLPTPLTKREAWLGRRIQQGLEEYQAGGAVLLHASPTDHGYFFALRASPAAHFIELIDCIHDALHKDVRGDEEPNA
jgi:hypothetical protein